ncbi:hypothetical protein [Burkholderia contaminans]|uniref:hypothetical protein n=1 Tax=Burkholderia contaminans TaxID=488447 RepID=UPI0011B22B7B|nr:hypothetical protein [Burkholderia contaminans]
MSSQPIRRANQALEAKVLSDYRRCLGRTVRVNRIVVEEDGRSAYRTLSRPALVEITATDADTILQYSTSDRITPQWNVRIVEIHDLVPDNARLRVFGTTRQASGESFIGDLTDVPLTAVLMAKFATIMAQCFVGTYRQLSA